MFCTDFKGDDLEESGGLPTKCSICEKSFRDPVILNCLHIFDRECLGKFEKNDGIVSFIKCPKCENTSGGLKTLESYDTSIIVTGVRAGENSIGTKSVLCSVCTEGGEALYKCIQCAGPLCERCRDIHKVMKVFSTHEVLDLTNEERCDPKVLYRNMKNSKPVICPCHDDVPYSLFCMQCHVPLCIECLESDHRNHITAPIDTVAHHLDPLLSSIIAICKKKQSSLHDVSQALHNSLSELSSSRDNTKNQVENLCNAWKTAIDAVREDYLRRNRDIHDDIEMKIWCRVNHISKNIDHIDFATEFSNSYLRKCSNLEMSRLAKVVLACFNSLSKINFSPDIPSRVLFTEPSICISDIIRMNFGTFSHPNLDNGNSHIENGAAGCLPHSNYLQSTNDVSEELKCLNLKLDNDFAHEFHNLNTRVDGINISPTGSHHSGRAAVALGNGSIDPLLTRPDALALVSGPTTWDELSSGLSSIDPSASGLTPDFLSSTLLANNFTQSNHMAGTLHSLDGDALSQKPKVSTHSSALYEYSRMRTARCSQMNLITKWGSQGSELGKLNAPHGFCLGFDEEIVVADTYNHRIQIFTKRGDFVCCFGVSGRSDGLLWYPRKVAIIRQSQRYVVCDRGSERSRMQLFSRSGHFVRRIPIRYIDIVAGLAINQHGHIVAIDSVSPSVFVVSEEGDLIRWFDCSNHMREPSDVAIHGREYYICDFKAHCVIVFQEDGTFIRRIGGETLTDYPNGIDVSDHGDVLVGDSHGNRFHIAVFSRTGELLSEFVCNQTKISRSCCLKITTEGYVVTLARSSNTVLVMDTLYIC
ncbi:unnamed protein product [Protopolystoma xenopodis]|uniref:B box-type domain-containing protein n=1 Tax=Protopolystoma xenopodis TaxID=117903 RepID=A0A448WE93_9PLAT|nr:unnamed protein product [Protopolystoma xenopodis]